MNITDLDRQLNQYVSKIEERDKKLQEIYEMLDKQDKERKLRIEELQRNIDDMLKLLGVKI